MFFCGAETTRLALNVIHGAAKVWSLSKFRDVGITSASPHSGHFVCDAPLGDQQAHGRRGGATDSGQEALQKLADERLVLVQELNHRVKNTLAIVQAMVARTLRDTHDVNEARNLLDGRLIALSKAHGILVMNSWEGGSLRELIDRAIPEFWPHRIASEGPDLKLHANHLVKLSMAFFELTTNAVKYGALSNNAGRVEIRWLRGESHGTQDLELNRIERGGPPVAAPQRRGFGT